MFIDVLGAVFPDRPIEHVDVVVVSDGHVIAAAAVIILGVVAAGFSIIARILGRWDPLDGLAT